MMPNQATTMQPTTLNKKTLTDQETCSLITNYFIQALKSPPSDEWNGNDGTIATIRNQLHLPQGSNSVIQNVLENLVTSKETCTKYMGEQKPGSGRKAELEKDIFQLQLVVDGMQNGLGYSGTHLLVNEFRVQNGQ